MIMPTWFLLLSVAPSASAHGNILASHRAKASEAEAKFVGENVPGQTLSQSEQLKEGGLHGHEASERTVVKSENGKTISETIRCRDGKCQISRSTGSAANGGDFDGFPRMQSVFRDADGSLLNSMRALRHHFGSLDDDFRSHAGVPSSMLNNLEDGSYSLKSATNSESSVMTETKVKNGEVIKTTKVCKNSHCNVHVDKGKSTGNALDGNDLIGFPAMRRSVDADGSFFGSMRAMENHLGSLGDDFMSGGGVPLNDGLRARGSIMAPFGDDFMNGAGFSKSIFNDLKDGADSVSGGRTSASSVTSETQVKDGKKITKTRVCKNGHCEEHVTHEDVAASKVDADKEKQGAAAIPQQIDSEAATEQKEPEDMPVY